MVSSLDGQQLAFNYADANNLPTLLDHYLTDRLGLPSVGEFDMEGSGRIFRDGQDVMIDYQSVANTYWDEDWKDEFTDEELVAMGVELPDRTATEAVTPVSEDKSDNSEEVEDAADSEDSKSTYDPDMSAEYSGRQVLFSLE